MLPPQQLVAEAASPRPDPARHARPVFAAMGGIARRALRAGRVGMIGITPNGQDFVANPIRIWVVDESNARLCGDDLGPMGPLADQTRLGDLWIPQRGIFAFGRTFFEGP